MVVLKKFSIKLVPADMNLSGRWYFHVKVFDPVTAEYKHLKKYDARLNRLKTIEARMAVLADAKQKILIGMQNTPFFASLDEYIEASSKKDEHSLPFIELLNRNFDKRQLKKKTIQTIQSKINNLNRWMMKKGLTALTNKDARLFLDECFTHSTTRNTNLASLRRLCQCANIDPNPFEGIENSRKTPAQGRLYFTRSQLTALKRAIKPENPMLWIACQMQYYCLIRNGEMRNLQVGNIDFDSEMITVLSSISKNNKRQPVKIPRVFLSDLEDYIGNAAVGDFVFSKSGSPGLVQIGNNYLHKTFDKYLVRLGIKNPRLSFYSLKKTGVKELVNKPNANLLAVRRQGRWSDHKQMEHYIADIQIADVSEYIDDMRPI